MKCLGMDGYLHKWSVDRQSAVCGYGKVGNLSKTDEWLLVWEGLTVDKVLHLPDIKAVVEAALSAQDVASCGVCYPAASQQQRAAAPPTLESMLTIV